MGKYNQVALSPAHSRAWSETRTALLWHCPAFTHVFYTMMDKARAEHVAVFTSDIPIAATDGSTLLLNPETFFKYSLNKRVFICAHEIMHAILAELQYVGVLCVEFFVDTDGQLLVNELAPRPHNSGHLTFDAAVTSQFEQQVRAVCGLSLGSPALVAPAAAMANLLGDLWDDGEPNWAAASRFGDVKIHLYGKSEARRGRKMGHLTAMGRTVDVALDRVISARDALGPELEAFVFELLRQEQVDSVLS